MPTYSLTSRLQHSFRYSKGIALPQPTSRTRSPSRFIFLMHETRYSLRSWISGSLTKRKYCRPKVQMKKLSILWAKWRDIPSLLFPAQRFGPPKCPPVCTSSSVSLSGNTQRDKHESRREKGGG